MIPRAWHFLVMRRGWGLGGWQKPVSRDLPGGRRSFWNTKIAPCWPPAAPRQYCETFGPFRLNWLAAAQHPVFGAILKNLATLKLVTVT